MARIGYARVSTLDQDLDLQVERLKAEGCSIVRAEKISGGSREGRVELETVIQFLRPGDDLVVARLDRLGRDTRDVLNIIHECEGRGAFVTVLDPHVSTRGEMGQIVLTVLGMVAQMERRFIKDRQRNRPCQGGWCLPRGEAPNRPRRDCAVEDCGAWCRSHCPPIELF